MLSFTMAHVVGDRAADQAAGSRAAVQGAGQRSRSRGRRAAAVRGARRPRDRDRPAWWRPCSTSRVLVSGRALDGRRDRALRGLPPPAGAAADGDRARWCCRSPRSSTRWSTSRCWWRSRTPTTPPRRSSTAVKLAARRRRGIHVLVTITVPANAPIDAPLPEQEARAQEVDRLGPGARRPAGDRALGEGPRRRGRPADRGGGARDPGAGDRDDAAAAADRRQPVRQDARDGAGGAPLPGDHRVLAAAAESRTAARPDRVA